MVSSSQVESVDAEKANTGHILVVGATGKIGSIVVKDIADLAPDIEITGTSRSHHSADEAIWQTSADQDRGLQQKI